MRDEKIYPVEETEPWQIKTRKRHKRIRKMTLAQAIRQARKAGVDAGVISVGGVTLEFRSKSHDVIKPNGHAIESADELRKLI